MGDEYFATGFADVDSAENADSYSVCLSLLDSLPYFKEYKRKTYELLQNWARLNAFWTQVVAWVTMCIEWLN